MSDMTDFLLARIAEREAWAREALALCDGIGVTREWRWVRFYGPADLPNMPSSSAFYRGAPTPDEVLAECEAMRRVVEMEWHHLGDEDYGWGMEEAKQQIVAVLALSYAAHPDYREEWRP